MPANDCHAARPGRRSAEQLRWFFGYAEAAMKSGGPLKLLSARDIAGLEGLTALTEGAVRRHARDLARRVAGQLGALPPEPLGVLRALYTPKRWPPGAVRAFGELTPVVVRLACAESPWPDRTAHDSLEQAVARRLARGVEPTRAAALLTEARRLRSRAMRRLARAQRKEGVSSAR